MKEFFLNLFLTSVLIPRCPRRVVEAIYLAQSHHSTTMNLFSIYQQTTADISIGQGLHAVARAPHVLLSLLRPREAQDILHQSEPEAVAASGEAPQKTVFPPTLLQAPGSIIRQRHIYDFIPAQSLLQADKPFFGLTKHRPFAFPSQRAFRTAASQTLARLETKANRERSNAAVQAAFYRELLRTNYPNLLIKRFEAGGVAAGPECESLYATALNRIGEANKAAEITHQMEANGTLPSQSEEAAISSTGGKQNPVYVQLAENRWTVGFRWLRFALGFGLAAYFFLVVIAIFAETSGFLKNGGKMTEIEAGSESKPAVKFSDVQGVEEAKEELEELVEFLRDPAKFTGLGGKLPKGVLLTGPPGTGKTLLARAVAGEAGVPFFFMSGSEFDEMYVGVGAKRVRDLFAAARAKAPSIVFIDELDAIGGKRNARDQAYAKQTLNQLLVDLDGFSQSTGVIFIGATNFPESLDKALTRPGRFDKHVVVPLPDVRGRMSILQHYMKGVQAALDVDVTVLARGTTGFSGADLQNLVNQAAIRASKYKEPSIQLHHFEWAKDKIIMGAERRSQVVTEESKRNTAYHEGGHAIVAMYTPGALPIYKATIMPRGVALGMVSMLPELDKDSMSRKEYTASIDVAMGGRIAEELIFGADNVTSGASSDISNATRVARKMITEFGLSEKVGPVNLEEGWADVSTPTKQLIEAEIRAYVEAGAERARGLLKEKAVEHERLAKALIEYESLTKDEIYKVVKGEKIDKLKPMPYTRQKVSEKAPVPPIPVAVS